MGTEPVRFGRLRRNWGCIGGWCDKRWRVPFRPNANWRCRNRPRLGPAVTEFIDEILRRDETAPRKQRHTAHRIWQRIRQERADPVAEATVRRYVRERKREFGLVARETFVPAGL